VFKREISTMCEIEAPIETVWEILTDLDGYDDWNPFVVRAISSAGGTSVGSLLDLTVRWHDGKTARSTEEVVQAQPPTEGARWSTRGPCPSLEARWVYRLCGWMPAIGMIRSVRTQWLIQGLPLDSEEEPDPPITGYVSSIELSGWGVGGMPLAKIEQGIQAQADALKAAAEARAVKN
jgi:hypothetical protein